jgi:hypothetical protein
MAENGLDLHTWLTVIGVFALFFGFPAGMIAFDLRKTRKQEDRARATSDPLHATVVVHQDKRPDRPV